MSDTCKLCGTVLIDGSCLNSFVHCQAELTKLRAENEALLNGLELSEACRLHPKQCTDAIAAAAKDAEIAGMRDYHEDKLGEWTSVYRKKLDEIKAKDARIAELVTILNKAQEEMSDRYRIITAQSALLAKALNLLRIRLQSSECHCGKNYPMVSCWYCESKEALALLDSSDPKAAEIERLKEAVIEAANNLPFAELTLEFGCFTDLMRALHDLDQAEAKSREGKP